MLYENLASGEQRVYFCFALSEFYVVVLLSWKQCTLAEYINLQLNSIWTKSYVWISRILATICSVVKWNIINRLSVAAEESAYIFLSFSWTGCGRVKYSKVSLIICIIAIAYSMGQIIKSFCVCACVRVCVCLSVCGHSHGRISSSIFTKLDTDV